jgi:drug/metabolite transporter (DMT)-like permease
MAEVIAVLAALGAAMLFGVAAVMEYQSAKQVPPRGALEPRLLLDLAHRPMWLLAIAANIVGVGLQIVALHFGPLALVQPVLVCDLIFAVLISAFTIRHRPPDRIMLIGVLCCAAGLGVFLATTQPNGGTTTVAPGDVVPLAAALAAVLAGCLAVARMASPNIRALALALACGVTYGVTAFLFKLLSQSLPEGFSHPLQQWPVYVVIVVGPIGFLLNQSAFQAGILVSPVLAVITVTDPLVSISIAYLWLNESIARSGTDVAIEVVSLIVMIAGIVALAQRAPQAAKSYSQAAQSQASLR